MLADKWQVGRIAPVGEDLRTHTQSTENYKAPPNWQRAQGKRVRIRLLYGEEFQEAQHIFKSCGCNGTLFFEMHPEDFVAATNDFLHPRETVIVCEHQVWTD